MKLKTKAIIGIIVILVLSTVCVGVIAYRNASDGRGHDGDNHKDVPDICGKWKKNDQCDAGGWHGHKPDKRRKPLQTIENGTGVQFRHTASCDNHRYGDSSRAEHLCRRKQ